MDDLLNDAVGALLADHSTPQVVRDIEAGGSAAELWTAIEESGFADALVDEAHGGAGLTLADAFAVFELCGTHALPVPLAETMLARALLTAAGIRPPRGSIALAQAEADGALSAHAAQNAAAARPATRASDVVCSPVHCARTADWALVSRGSDCRLLAVADAQALPAVFCLDATLEWTDAVWARAPRLSSDHDVRTLQACAYAAQLAGAMMATFARTLRYANDRQQFGRPIGKFQAIQHQLGVMSEQAFAARMAARIGCRAAGIVPERQRVAVAKARASEAAVEVAALTHSIHGAIGFTREFDLQLYTRRLHSWRQAAGSESYWHAVLGTALVAERGATLDLLRAMTDPLG